MPDINELKKSGCSDEEIKKIEASYIIKKVNTQNNLYSELNEIGLLFSNYQIKDMEIGMISFFEKPIKKDSTYILGKIEMDELIYSLTDEKIYIQERGYQVILCDCAKGIANFLSALAILSEHFSKVMLDNELYDDLAYLEKIAISAANAAGNESYLNFYKMLLGI